MAAEKTLEALVEHAVDAKRQRVTIRDLVMKVDEMVTRSNEMAAEIAELKETMVTRSNETVAEIAELKETTAELKFRLENVSDI